MLRVPDPSETTRLLNQAGLGDAQAAQSLQHLVYEQLRVIAQARMAQERPDHTLQATALVHEVYLKLFGNGPVEWVNRAQFFAAAAEAMRRILIDHARTRGRAKRGGAARRVPLSGVDLASEETLPEILALDEALCRLEERDAGAARVVRLRFYAGLSIEQTAEALGVSPRTVKREWAFARAWLYRALGDGEDPREESE